MTEQCERTLLLVDDEPNIITALTRLLRRDGYTILRADGGEEGLKVLEEHSVGVIVSDQRMPGMTGSEFLSKVKTTHPQSIRIMLSGYSDLESVTDAINRGEIYRFLTKPWQDDLLRENIKDAFHSFELEEVNRGLKAELNIKNAALERLNKELSHQLGDELVKNEMNMHALQVGQAVFDYLPMAAMGVDETGMIVIANQAFKSLCGKETLVGCELNEILVDNSEQLLSCSSDGGGPVTTQITGVDGDVTVLPRGFEIQTGGRGILMIFEPVTAQL